VIYLRISQATRNVSTLGSEFVHAKAPDIEVAMSPAQFAQFVTSVGLGDGTPCTITAFHGQQVASCPSQTPRHVLAEAGINSDIARRINALKPRLETIEKTIDDTKMTQKAAAKLRGQVRGLVRNLTSDLEFAQVTLQEAGADYLQEVEIAAEAAVGDLLRRAGADILASRVDTPRALTEGDETCT
jgi:DNA-binding FrmR family transcriptional regulator